LGRQPIGATSSWSAAAAGSFTWSGEASDEQAEARGGGKAPREEAEDQGESARGALTGLDPAA
jgi:hypothetical protein